MGRTYDRIDERLAAFLLRQPVFFVGTAPLAADGHVNLSPKGLAGTFAVLDAHRLAYLDLTGSGVETIAHLRDNGRIVVMCCAFAGPPRIVRLHGRGRVHPAGSASFASLRPHFSEQPGVRSIIEIEVERIADSCGFGVPEMRYVGDRNQLSKWAEAKEQDDALEAYHAAHDVSIDGLPGLQA